MEEPLRARKAQGRTSAGILTAFCISALFGVTACNGSGDASGQSLENATNSVVANAAPETSPETPSSGTDSSSPTSNPSPRPSASASPIPTGADLYSGPAEVEKYVTKFVADAIIQGIDVLPDMKNPQLTIQIASLDQYGAGVIGLCETAGDTRRVTFDPDFWNSVDDTQREILAHHELGHCVLGRPHRTDTLTSGEVASIMYPTIMSNATYKGNYDYYQKELYGYAASQARESGPLAETIHICDLNHL